MHKWTKISQHFWQNSTFKPFLHANKFKSISFTISCKVSCLSPCFHTYMYFNHILNRLYINTANDHNLEFPDSVNILTSLTS